MNIHTINAIAVILSLFTEEEKEGLKITLGTREISLRDQLRARWHKAMPRFFDSVFLAKAAHIINGNKLLFLRAIEFNKPEFQEKLKELLSNPESYVKIKETKTDNKTTQKGVSTGQSDRQDLSRTFNKNRSGQTESGQEYIDLESIWEKEDHSHLAHGLAPSPLQTRIELDPSKQGIDGISLSVLTQEQNRKLDWPQPEPLDINKEDMPLHTITTSQGRGQTLSEIRVGNLNIKDENNTLDGKSVTKDMVTIEALQLMTATRIKDPRETAFQKLDVLFNQCH